MSSTTPVRLNGNGRRREAPDGTSTVALLPRRVGKSGAVCISGLPPGTRVHVALVSPGVYVVSPLPEADVRRIVERLPKPPESPYAALTDLLAERKRPAQAMRAHHTFTGVIEEQAESPEAVLERARLQKPSRAPR